WHLETGMLAQFLELPDDIKILSIPTAPQWAVQTDPHVKNWNDLCVPTATPTS
ncbi:9358_t:CDS:1, partial [Cetraspora pellucida]